MLFVGLGFFPRLNLHILLFLTCSYVKTIVLSHLEKIECLICNIYIVMRQFGVAQTFISCSLDKLKTWFCAKWGRQFSYFGLFLSQSGFHLNALKILKPFFLFSIVTKQQILVIVKASVSVNGSNSLSKMRKK